MMYLVLARIDTFLHGFAAVAASKSDCTDLQNKTFFGLPTWYKYLEVEYVPVNGGGGVCKVILDIQDNPLGVGLVGLAVIEMLLRVGGVVAVGFVIYGGIQYIVSQGEPENTAKALHTIINACIGLAIVMISAAVVAFIGTSLGE